MGGKSLIPDYTILRKIWTHPKVLENAYQNAMNHRREKLEKAMPKRVKQKDGPDSEEEPPDDVLDSITGEMAVTENWWRDLIKPEDMETILPSNKLRILFEILKFCQQNNEKW